MQDIHKVYHQGDETTEKDTLDLQKMSITAEDETAEEDTFGRQKAATSSSTMQQM